MTEVNFRFTQSFIKSFDTVVDHLMFYNQQNSQSIHQAKQAVLKAQQVIEQHPQAYPINQDIAEYGLKYLEANIKQDNKGFRILYSINQIDDQYQIDFELFLLQKMSVQKALTQFLLMH